MGFTNKFNYTDFHELNLDWLLKNVQELNSSVDDIIQTLEKIKYLTPEQVQSMINTSITDNNRNVLQPLLDQMKQDITTDYKAYCDGAIATLKSYVDSRDLYYDAYAQAYSATALYQAKQYADQKLDSYCFMFSPITGVYEDVRQVVQEIIAYYHGDEILTAAEYDALDLTASGYDAYDLTAVDYDLQGKTLLV